MRVTQLFFLFCMIMWSCDTSENRKQETAETIYLDLPKIIEEEIEYLDSKKLNFERISTFNNKSDTLNSNELDWKKEFALLENADINKKSFIGKYQETTSFDSNSSTSFTTFTAIDSSLKTKWIKVSIQPNGASAILSKITQENPLYTSSYLITYYRDSIFEIEGLHKINFSKENRFKIRTIFNY